MKRIFVVLIFAFLLLVSCGTTRFYFDRSERNMIELGGVYNSETEKALKALYENEGMSGVLREVSLGTYTEIDVQGYLGDAVYQYYLDAKEESLEENEPETIAFMKQESSDGNDWYKAEKSLEGFYWLTDSDFEKNVLVGIKIDGNDLYFELKEDGGENALSTIRSLSEEYTVCFYAKDFKTGQYCLQEAYDGILCRNENNVYNTIKLESANWLLTDVDFGLIEIWNDNGIYQFNLDSTCIEDILFDVTTVLEAEALVEKEGYEEAISLLSNFEYTDRCSFEHYDCDLKIETYKEALYQKALKCFLAGNYEETLDLASGRIMSYKDTMRLIKESKKALGITGVGGIITFGEGWNGEPIDWLILDIAEGKELLLSFDILFNMEYDELPMYDELSADSTWETCSLRKILNDDTSDGFLGSCFTEEERKRIVEVENSPNYNRRNHPENGNKTLDKVFLLSSVEVLTYLSPYYQSSAMKGKTVSEWWTRTIGEEQGYAETVAVDSAFWFSSENVSSYSGVRPAIWISID